MKLGNKSLDEGNELQKMNLANLGSAIESIKHLYTDILIINPVNYEILSLSGFKLKRTNNDCRNHCPLAKDSCGCICKDSISNNQKRCRFIYDSLSAYFVISEPIKIHFNELIILFITKLDPTFSFGANKESKAIEDITKVSSNLVIDPLTNIYNRKYLMDNIEYMMRAAEKAQKPLCLASIDVDNFKHFNDTYGHDFGDKVLQKTAELMSKSIENRNAYPIRIGGDEFEIVGIGIPKAQFKTLMSNLCIMVENTKLPFNGKPVGIKISIGVAEMQSDKCTNFKELYDVADKHLYMAKEAGKGCVR